MKESVSVSAMLDQIRDLSHRIDRPARYMEVCGTHTVSFFRTGIRAMLPENVKMISGPGCPVCVTAQRHIDAAIQLATRPQVIIATYGDMLRVPGRLGSLERRRAEGARVQVVTSAQSALDLARAHSDKQVVFLAVGFETTAPATAVVIRDAEREGIDNFSVLMCHKLIIPAMLALLEDGQSALDGFLCPGHVSVIIGASAYRPVVARHRVPCVVAGFEPLQMLLGVRQLLRQTLEGRAELENVYPACVHTDGNQTAVDLMREIFREDDVPWRALGSIPLSGLRLAPRFARFDATARFDIVEGDDVDHPGCRCGEVIQGRVEPSDCPLFGNPCTPHNPIGPCMVSSEGTCAAWYRYQANEGNRRRFQSAGEELSCRR